MIFLTYHSLGFRNQLSSVTTALHGGPFHRVLATSTSCSRPLSTDQITVLFFCITARSLRGESRAFSLTKRFPRPSKNLNRPGGSSEPKSAASIASRMHTNSPANLTGWSKVKVKYLVEYRKTSELEALEAARHFRIGRVRNHRQGRGRRVNIPKIIRHFQIGRVTLPIRKLSLVFGPETWERTNTRLRTLCPSSKSRSKSTRRKLQGQRKGSWPPL